MEKTSEWIDLNQHKAITGPELPWEFSYGCATNMNTTHAILLGGSDHPTRSLIVDFEYIDVGVTRFTRGPDLDTTEILNVDLVSNGWSPGKTA